MSRLEQYIPERGWFDRQDDKSFFGMHGIGHITRVLVWSEQISTRVATSLRLEELLWAAGLHDIKRHDDGGDRYHGERAAAWVRESFARVRPDDAAALDIDLLASLCRDHQRPDHLVEDWPAELRVLKDADGLERVRIHDLDPSRLRLQAISPALEPLARDLMSRSVARGNTADAVRSVAEDMGLWT